MKTRRRNFHVIHSQPRNYKALRSTASKNAVPVLPVGGAAKDLEQQDAFPLVFPTKHDRSARSPNIIKRSSPREIGKPCVHVRRKKHLHNGCRAPNTESRYGFRTTRRSRFLFAINCRLSRVFLNLCAGPGCVNDSRRNDLGRTFKK